ncbi:MAG: acyl-CoA dehydratase activase [Acidaminobacteraceae bacterium]
MLFDGNHIVDEIMLLTGANPRSAINKAYSRLNVHEGAYVVTTGYGRNLLKESDKKVTEITCHGRGASYLSKEISAVIDIGGQDSKVILLDKDKNIVDFLMNDKCAAGTGRFIEVIMRILQHDIDDIDEYIRDVTPTKISSMCTVFAESEVISLLSEDVSGNSIAMGLIDSICERTSIFSKRLPLQGKVFFSGGLAKSDIIKSVLENKLKLEVVTHPMSQYVGAIGAAVIGFERMNIQK